MKPLKKFCLCLGDQEMMPTALKVSALVGSILFTINHGSALIKGQMSRDRWLSGGLTYIVPYCVSIHGQYTSRSRKH
ncbi:MAG: nitrate/nitrite transporter NrtS [Pleurocapsa sp.]